MSDKYEKLDETFNVEPVEVEVTEKKIEKDYQYLIDMIEHQIFE